MPEKGKKKAEVFLQISRQPRRVSGRARDFQRARRPGFSGGPGIPSQSPESPGPAVSQVVLGACKRRGPGLQPDPSQEVVVVLFPSLRPLDTG